MPELPEVENTVRSLNQLIINKRIKNIWTDTPKLIRGSSLQDLQKIIKNKKIISVCRRAKNIIFILSDDYALLIHLKMTGHLLIGRWQIKKIKNKEVAISINKGALSEKVNGYIHFIFYFEDGSALALSDLRKFAKIIIGKQNKIYADPGIKNAGEEATEITLSTFSRVLLSSFKNIKSLLMDQTKIAGIGNIYSDDILFKAKIHPLRKASSLSQKEIKAIYSAMKQILALAIRLGGTSISDYRDTMGERGHYGDYRLVYRRDGKNCFICNTPIQKIKINGRSSRFCLNCQK